MEITILGTGTATPNLERNASGLAVRTENLLMLVDIGPGVPYSFGSGRTAARAGAKKLVLTHFYPPCDEVDIVTQAAAFFSGEIVKAKDLMVIQV